MLKHLKEKHHKKEYSEIRSAQLKKFSLIIMSILTCLLVAFGVYLYMSTLYKQTPVVQPQPPQQQVSANDDLMRKMKQMLDEEKERQSQLPPSPSSSVDVNVSEANKTVTEVSVSEENNVTQKNESVAPHEDDHKPNILSEVHEYQHSMKESGKTYRPNEVVRKKYPEGTTPRLAIIIDDVSFPWQTRMIKEIPYKVTPAFFPPTKGHPETVRLSHEFPFAMIHLPMESKNYSSPEEDTLNTTDSIEVIEKRIKRIKEWFPHIVYYNNHTGGYFTADYNAMDRLIKTMKDHGLIFVDSRTIGDSKAPAVTRKYDMFLYSRDVFLDNSLDKNTIRHQLKEAVNKAHKNGYAIAIGHPHKNTLEVLRDSKELLQGVDVVYLKEL